MDKNKKLTGQLNHLISIAKDGAQGYENAAEDVKDVALQQMFREYSSQRSRYAEELSKEVADLGGSPDDSGGPLGALHRTWMDIKSAITSGSRDAILKACITGEEAAVKAYTEVKEEPDLAISTKEIISSQLGGVEAALNSIRSLVNVHD